MLTATAVDPGAWAESYGIETRAASGKNFQFLVMRKSGDSAAPVEIYSNVSLDKASPRFVESVVNGKSDIVTVEVPKDAAAAANHNFAPLDGGEDGEVLAPTQSAFFGQIPSAMDRLARVELFNLLAVPGLTDAAQIQKLATFCREKRAFLIVDADPETKPDVLAQTPAPLPAAGPDRTHAALYYPWVLSPDPAQSFVVRPFPPSGFVAGIYARTDATRGVWKAPAGTEAGIAGALGLSRTLTDDENGLLNPKGVNCLRSFPVFGPVVWGTRTTDGNDETGSEWRAIPVRRLALFIEESLYRGLKWTVFEHNLFRQGAFQGRKASDAFFVRCDKDTTTQADINLGIVNVVVGFAPLQPAEFVIIQLQQKAGQLES
jgi:phage tail sheath protein FI